MSASNKNFGLGKGIGALLGDDVDTLLDDNKPVDNFAKNAVFKGDGVCEIRLDNMSPYTFQPRMVFDEEGLKSLSDSIREKGVLQPLLVRKKGERYEIIAGERRWRAARMAGLEKVPAIVKELSDQETLEIALIENLQRENLSAIEEAEGLNRLMQDYDYTQDTLGKVIGKSRSYVANSLRLLSLPEEVRLMICDNKLSAGHARALVGLPNATEVAQKIITKELSVRQTEQLVAELKNPKPPVEPKRVDFDLQKIMADLEKKLSLKVKINAGKNGKGSVTLKYNNPAELSSILDILEQR